MRSPEIQHTTEMALSLSPVQSTQSNVRPTDRVEMHPSYKDAAGPTAALSISALLSVELYAELWTRGYEGDERALPDGQTDGPGFSWNHWSPERADGSNGRRRRPRTAKNEEEHRPSVRPLLRLRSPAGARDVRRIALDCGFW